MITLITYRLALNCGETDAADGLLLQAIGEPPLLLSCAMFYAIRNAIKSARADAGLPADFVFNSPATVGKILLACTAP